MAELLNLIYNLPSASDRWDLVCENSGIIIGLRYYKIIISNDSEKYGLRPYYKLQLKKILGSYSMVALIMHTYYAILLSEEKKDNKSTFYLYDIQQNRLADSGDLDEIVRKPLKCYKWLELDIETKKVD